MKKRLLALMFVGAMALSLAACGSSASGDASADASGDVEKPEYNVSDYVTLGQYMDLEVTATQYEATQDDYDEYLEELLEGEAYYPESDKEEVEDGDTVNIDYVGTIDGEEFDGGSSEGYELEIGSDTFVDDFEDQLIGAKVGDTVTVEVTFPDDYSSEDLQGKDASFEVTINYILADEEVVPEYTDDFVNEYTDGEYTTTADYDEYIWDTLEETAESDTSSSVESAVEELVYENCTVSGLPDGLVDYYYAQYKATDEAYAENYGLEFEDYISYVYGYSDEDTYKEQLTTYLEEEYLPEALIREAIVEDMGLEVTDEILDNFMLVYASYYGYEDVDSFISAYGFDDVDAFIEYVGEDSINEAALNLEMWNVIEDSAVVTYVAEDESGDAE